MQSTGRRATFVASILGLAVVVAGIRAGAAPQAGSPLAALKDVYAQQTAKIEYDYEAGMLALDARYPRDLNTLKTRAQQAGNLDGVMAADAELRRFEAERNIPAAASPGLPDDLLALQAGHRKARGDLAGDRATKTLALVRMYLQRLENMRKNLTIAGRLDEALAVNAEVERVKASPAVTAAEFAAAASGGAGPVEGAGSTNAASGSPAAASGPRVADLKLPVNVTMHEGSAPAVGSVTMKSQSLIPSSRAKLTRKLSASAAMGESGGPTRTGSSSVYSSSSSQSGTTTHHVRIGLRPSSTQYRFGGGTLVVQYFAKALGTQGKVVPKLAATQTIPLPLIDMSAPVTVDCAPVSLYSYSYRYRSYYGSRYNSEGGMDLYGIAVSVFEADGGFAYQGVSSSSLDTLAVEAAPADGSGTKIVDDGAAEMRLPATGF